MPSRTAKKATTKKAASKPKPKPKPRNNMPKAPRSPKEARDFYVSEVRHPTKDWSRLCLQLFRTSYGIPAKEATALDAWQASGGRHAFTSQDDIPFGAAVFSKRPGAGPDDAGHIFFIGGYNSDGERICRSNDIRAVGEVDPVPFSAFHDVWGHEILGWRDNVNGYSLGLGTPPSKELVKRMRERRHKD